jgi:hypothetical protein
MTWQTIAASETDANSPLNQTLMDKIREDLDDLHAAGAQVKFLKGTAPDAGSGYDVILDADLDYRGRMVKVTGIVWGGSEAGVAAHQPGGANDHSVHSQVLSHGSINAGINAKCLINDWLYTSTGGANHGTEPYLTFANGQMLAANIWVATDGKLKLGITTGAAAGYRASGWELAVVYSEDLGGY